MEAQSEEDEDELELVEDELDDVVLLSLLDDELSEDFSEEVDLSDDFSEEDDLSDDFSEELDDLSDEPERLSFL